MAHHLAASRAISCIAALTLALGCRPAPHGVDASAIELRNLGIAQLENEQPKEAEATFRRLQEVYPEDPLALADLTVALLRQHKQDEARTTAEQALALDPQNPRLLLLQGDVLQWTGDADAALGPYRDAAERAPQDPEIQYALYRLATSLEGDTARQAADAALERLVTLRPENLVVLLDYGQQALARDDRAEATRVYLRLRELLFLAPAAAERPMAQVLDALESGDLEAAQLPARFLRNAFLNAPGFKTSLADLYVDVQGHAIQRFAKEPPIETFGDPVPVSFDREALGEEPTLSVALADFDRDGTVDIARIVEGGGVRKLLVQRSSSADVESFDAGGASRLCTLDLDNDGALDLLVFGSSASTLLLRGDDSGRFTDASGLLEQASSNVRAVAPLDFDSEGDLDLFALRKGGGELLRNTLSGPLQPIPAGVVPLPADRELDDVAAFDLDRDGDTDLFGWGAQGVVWLDNLRQGSFADRTAERGLPTSGPVAAAVVADLDNDGLPELMLGGDRLTLLHNDHGSFVPWDAQRPELAGPITAIETFDADNDGRLDLALVASGEAVVLAQRGSAFERLEIDPPTSDVRELAVEDMDGDGDLDLVAAGASGLILLRNDGGNANHWLRVSLRGLTKGNDKNNTFGYGASLEVLAGAAYQYREATQPVTHFGLGALTTPDALRAVWNNGVPQNRLHPSSDQLLVEEQVLKGSCPFLYTWDGKEVRFVTDLLWGAPIGMPVAEGEWAGADPGELVRVDGAAPRDGTYDLRITEELWEAAYFDRVRLWVVDHPSTTEAASSLRVFAGPAPAGAAVERVLLAADLHPVASAWDGQGRDVTERVRQRDDVYADGYPVGEYQGATPEPWAFTFDLGVAPAAPIRLLLDGWIFPADASLNLAIAQRHAMDMLPTRLEVETAGGWQTLLDPMGFPAGKTKTMAIDTPPLPAGAHLLRIRTSRWLHWDRIVWSTAPRDADARVVAKLAPSAAELAYRGFSRLERLAPNAPHGYDYATTRAESPWLPMGGPYTRYGDVLELLTQRDDRLVVLGSGDEVRLSFDASTLPPPAAGMQRTLFLESFGWDKDADRNTYRADSTEPLPFGAMSGYPYPPGEYPATESLRRYREQWLTRDAVGSPAAR